MDTIEFSNGNYYREFSSGNYYRYTIGLRSVTGSPYNRLQWRANGEEREISLWQGVYTTSEMEGYKKRAWLEASRKEGKKTAPAVGV